MCDLKTEQDQEAEENSMMYADLKAARETIADLKQSKGSASVYTCLCDILQIFVTDCAKCNCKKKKCSICCLVGRFRFSHFLFFSDDKCHSLISHLYEMSLSK